MEVFSKITDEGRFPDEGYRVNDTAKAYCRTILDVVSAHGVREVVCSPGSRNTPLLIAAAARAELRKHVVADERCAAFMALGIAAAGRKPVALVCTSGTALLNYAPAVAEAFYQGVPLIVITADRPSQWIDQDDSQTIRQEGAFANFIKRTYHIESVENPSEEDCWYVNRIVNDAMTEALSRRQGPVHINISLAPPLGKTIDIPRTAPRMIRLLEAEPMLSNQRMRELADYAAGKKILLIAGFMPPDNELNRAVAELASLPNVYVMAETISNLHLPGRSWNIDTMLSIMDTSDKDSLRPDIIISIGGALVSRMAKAYLRECTEAENWAVGYFHTTVDCFQSLTLRIEADRSAFLRRVARLMRRDSRPLRSAYSESWRRMAEKSMVSHSRFLKELPWCEMSALETLLNALPASANLYLSNGTAIRYAQLLMNGMPHACYCNRGVSGIDGCTSTAVGGAMTYGGLTVLVSGDMSFSYDCGALNIREIPDTMRIAVVKNGGGGIFRFIASTSALEQRERYFCADPEVPVEGLARAYGWRYLKASSMTELESALPSFFSAEAPKSILEIDCDGILSAEILKSYMSRNYLRQC